MIIGRFSFGFRLIIVLGIVMALAITSPVEAKKKKPKRKPKAPRAYYLDVSLNLTYDDNILRYSDSDLDAFNVNPDDSKYAIESKSDWIVSPQLDARLKGKFIAGHTGWLSLGYAYSGYIENDIRRYSRFAFDARQYFNSRTYMQLVFAYIPSYYYRNVLYSGAGQSEYLEAKFSKPSLGLEIARDLTKTLRASLEYLYQHKSYEEKFQYRNLNVHGLDVWLISREFKSLKLWLNSGFEIASAKGADMADTILDVSYDAWDMTLGGRHYCKLFRKQKPELYISLQYRSISYQSSRLPDIRRRHIYHFGRNDDNYAIKVGTDWRIPLKFNLGISYSLYMKRTHLPDLYPDLNINVPETTAELEKKLNYNANSISIKLTRRI